MMRKLALLLVVVLGSCGGPREGAPSNLDNACLMLQERPSWRRDLRRVEDRYGIPRHVILATIYYESRFDEDARTPRVWKLGFIPWGRRSTAFGYSQALDGTWEEYQEATGNRRADRTRFRDATDFMGWYMRLSVERNGIAPTDAYNQYLAYHEGHAGWRRGTYNRKSWLPPYARRVAERAQMYEGQLRRC